MATIGSDVYAVGFDRNIHRTVEVKGGLLRPRVRLATGVLYHKEGVYPRMSGGGLPSKRINRFGNSPVSESDYSCRRVTRDDYEDGQFLDWADLSRMCVDPKSEKLDIMLQKFRRNEDIILTQAMLGSAQGGNSGETATDFDTDNIIDVTIDALSGDTNAGFNYGKFLATIELFGTNNVDVGATPPTFVISWKQWRDICNDEKFINKDYSMFQNQGGLGRWSYMGCDFVITNILPYMTTEGTGFRVTDTDITTATGVFADTDDTDIRAAFAFVQDAALLEINPDIVTEMTKRGDKGFNWYAYLKMSLGAVRMEESKVIAIPCDQTP